MIIDNFIDDFDLLKKESISGMFIDEINPIDGVIYPLINRTISSKVQDNVINNLNKIFGREIIDPLIFMRKSPIGVKYPNEVHSDNSMGKYSLMLYINDETEGAGTSLVKHKRSGITHAPEDPEFLSVIQFDQNNQKEWEIYEMFHMKPNRAAIFDSNRLHRAEPVGGFGEGKEARVVLTCFFS